MATQQVRQWGVTPPISTALPAAEEELLALEKLQDSLRQRRQAEAAVSPPPKAQEQRATTAPAQPAAPQGAPQAMPPVPAR